MTHPIAIEPGFIFWGLPVALLIVLALYLVGVWAVERREPGDDG